MQRYRSGRLPDSAGVQFITWERVQERTGLNAGNYYGPLADAECCSAAKQNFAVRSGLIPHSAIFSPEQLTAIYHSVHEILENVSSIAGEQRKCLESAAEQIERSIPELERQVVSAIKRRWRRRLRSPRRIAG